MAKSSSPTKTAIHGLRKRSQLSREREKALVLAAQAGDEQATVELIEAHLACIAKFARDTRRTFRGHDEADLIQEGVKALLRSITLFDTSRNLRLLSYAYRGIRQAILHYRYSHGSTIYVPQCAYDVDAKKASMAMRVSSITVNNREYVDVPIDHGDFELVDASDDSHESRTLHKIIATLKPRTALIVRCRLRGEKFDDIAKRCATSRARVQQIYAKAVETIIAKMRAAFVNR